MGTLTIDCALSTALPNAVTVLNPCPEEIGQIQKMVFWRRGQTMLLTSAVTLTAWTTLLSATGDTKAVVTPYMANVVIPPSEAREFGGGNETKWGSPLRKGGASVPVTGAIYQVEQDIIAALKSWSRESLDVVLINEANQLIYDDSTAASIQGFPVIEGSFFISDKGIGGLDDSDMNNFMFNLRPLWSDKLEATEATVFALDMVNA